MSRVKFSRPCESGVSGADATRINWEEVRRGEKGDATRKESDDDQKMKCW